MNKVDRDVNLSKHIKHVGTQNITDNMDTTNIVQNNKNERG